MCYPNGSYFRDEALYNQIIMLNVYHVFYLAETGTGQWVRVADPLDPVTCGSNSNDDPFQCSSSSNDPATVTSLACS